jgi:hypothetical protein
MDINSVLYQALTPFLMFWHTSSTFVTLFSAPPSSTSRSQTDAELQYNDDLESLQGKRIFCWHLT